jgi:hypothetical protein
MFTHEPADRLGHHHREGVRTDANAELTNFQPSEQIHLTAQVGGLRCHLARPNEKYLAGVSGSYSPIPALSALKQQRAGKAFELLDAARKRWRRDANRIRRTVEIAVLCEREGIPH